MNNDNDNDAKQYSPSFYSEVSVESALTAKERLAHTDKCLCADWLLAMVAEGRMTQAAAVADFRKSYGQDLEEFRLTYDSTYFDTDGSELPHSPSILLRRTKRRRRVTTFGSKRRPSRMTVLMAPASS